MTIHPQELQSLVHRQADFLLLDVREEWEYEEYNLGGLNIPLYSLPQRLSEITQWKNKAVVVHCKSGNRGKTGVKYLLKNGFSDVKNLEGGLQEFLKLFPQGASN